MLILLANKFAKTKLAALKYVPDTLVMVVLGIILNYFIKFDQWGVKPLGSMQQGFEAPKVRLLAVPCRIGFLFLLHLGPSI